MLRMKYAKKKFKNIILKYLSRVLKTYNKKKNHL